MPVRRAFKGDNVIYRNAKGESMALVVQGAQGLAPAAPTTTTATTGGTLAAGTYNYRVTYVKDGVESEVSTLSAGQATTGTTSTVTVNWVAVPGATSYKVYGRTSGSQLLMSTVTAPTVQFVDTGAVTPAGAAPASNFNVTVRDWFSGHGQHVGVLPGLTAGTYEKH